MRVSSEGRRTGGAPASGIALLLLAASLFAICQFSQAAELRGKVVAVSDGDTLTVLDDSQSLHRVRLHGIDAPEKGQPYGMRAKQQLATLAFGKPVVVVIESLRPVRGEVRWFSDRKAGIVFDQPLKFEELAEWIGKRLEMATLKAGAKN